LVALIIALMAWVGCGGGGDDTPDPPAEQTAAAATQAAAAEPVSSEPIKIGLLHPHTGALAGLGLDMTSGYQHYFEQIGMQVAGRPIEIIVEDSEGNPSVGLDKLKKLIERENVHVMAGPVSSGVAYGIADYIRQAEVPIFITQATANGLTQGDRAPNIFRTAFSSDQLHLPMGDYFINELGYTKVAGLALDYAAGHEHLTAFKNSLERAGGEMVQELYPRLGETETSTYITSIKADEVDAVNAILWGATAVPFINQQHEFGLRKKVPLTGLGSVVEDELELPNQTPEAAEGVISYLAYCLCLDTPANNAFKTSYEAANGRLPNYYTAIAYTGARALAEALEAVNGNVEDTDAFLAAAREVTFDGPMGPFRYDEYQNPILNVYVRKVEIGEDGKARNVLEDTIENVDQFWGMSAEEKDALLNPS
jgi:branched-chain amino acid transport system substrate-binding protein